MKIVVTEEPTPSSCLFSKEAEYCYDYKCRFTDSICELIIDGECSFLEVKDA